MRTLCKFLRLVYSGSHDHEIFRCVRFHFLLGCLVRSRSGTRMESGLCQSRSHSIKPVHLAGYASRNKPFESVEARLFAKALALTDGKKRVALITTDLIGFNREVVEPICESIMEKTGLVRSEILLNASHIHTGPTLTLDPDGKGGAAQVEYTKSVQKKIAELAIKALESKMREVEIDRGNGIAHFVMNRREWTRERGVILGVNPSGPVDRKVPVLKIAERGEDGKILGVVFQCACHNTTLGSRFYGVTGDYAGYAQSQIEAGLPGVQAMFMSGCGGDANPHPRNSLDDSKKHGKALGEEVLRVLADSKSLKPIRGKLGTAFSKRSFPWNPFLPRPSWRSSN